MHRPLINVVDFFSGCGGTSCGFEAAGLQITLGLDFDSDSQATFQQNFPRAGFILQDVREVPESQLFGEVGAPKNGLLLFSGCAPCQPFTKQRTQKQTRDTRRTLLGAFAKHIAYWKPHLVFVENVPGLQKVGARSGPFAAFLKNLRRLGYFVSYGVVAAGDYGVPQKRERLVVMASLLGPIDLPKASHGPGLLPVAVVRDWISALPALAAGQADDSDGDHRAAALSTLNLKRIQATKEGGGREDWPPALLLKCHQGHIGHSDVYGRLSWDKAASALTTRCISYSNGRFGHPDQDRAISLREAACLQTFPRKWKFSGRLQSKARQVGNAVPPLMAQRFGLAFLEHAAQYLEKKVA